MTQKLVSITSKFAIIFLLIGLVIKIPALLLDIQSLFYFGFSFSIVGAGFLLAYIVNSTKVFKKLKLETKFSDEDKKYLRHTGLLFVIPVFFTVIMIMGNYLTPIESIIYIQILLTIWLPFLIYIVDKNNLRNIQKENGKKKLEDMDFLLIQMSISLKNLYGQYKIILKRSVDQSLEPYQKSSYITSMNWAYLQINSHLSTFNSLTDFAKKSGILPSIHLHLNELKIQIDKINESPDQDTISRLSSKMLFLAQGISILGHDRPHLTSKFKLYFRDIIK